MASYKKMAQNLLIGLNRAGEDISVETRRYYNRDKQHAATYYTVYRYIIDPDDPDKRKRVLLCGSPVLADCVQVMADLYREATK